jgi:hypothetical protein
MAEKALKLVGQEDLSSYFMAKDNNITYACAIPDGRPPAPGWWITYSWLGDGSYASFPVPISIDLVYHVNHVNKESLVIKLPIEEYRFA